METAWKSTPCSQTGLEQNLFLIELKNLLFSSLALAPKGEVTVGLTARGLTS